MDFAEDVLRRIEELGLNINQAEARAGLPQGYIRGVVRDDDKRATPSIYKAKRIAEALDLELYIGPPREKGPPPVLILDARDYTAVPLVAAEASAGPGANNDREEIEDLLAFRSDWLRKLGVKADDGVLVRVRGDSMEPTLHAGDLALIDRGRREIRSGRVYALNDADSQTRIKRIDRAGDRGLILRSDNPAHPAELRLGLEAAQLDVVGEVVWSGHTWR